MNNLLNDLKTLVEQFKNETNETAKQALKVRMITTLSSIFKNEAVLFNNNLKNKIVTTRDNYGDFMGILGTFKGLYRLGFAKALIDNGGNKEGINNALSLLSGSDNLDHKTF